MARKLGDVYRVGLNGSTVAYFQHVADDSTQLGSNVIAVFRGRWSKDDPPRESEMLATGVEFFAHVALPVGLKRDCWKNVGWCAPLDVQCGVAFRIANEHGPSVKHTKSWSIWKTGEPLRRIASSSEEVRRAEIGLVVNPRSLLHRIQHGHYDFIYPDFA